MAVKIRDLDKLLADLQATERLETSLTITNPILRNKDTETYNRAGLGKWSVIVLRVRGLPSLFLGVPEGDESAGFSIWYKAKSRLTPSAVAEAVRTRLQDKRALFLDPLTGEQINPSGAELAEYRQEADGLRGFSKGVRIREKIEKGRMKGLKTKSKFSAFRNKTLGQ